ncbi:nucleotidyltransferase family protein [Mesohalobacter salilacus]|uniref:nucleotidyltransferase family protein n=1 Tax=Mesohalobacter salilacus TaxID=2491711 RepID=UPI00403EB34B
MLCKKHKVKELYVFGSVVNQNSKSYGDIDFLVEFNHIDPLEYFDNYLKFKHELESLFAKKVDLVEVQTLKNPVLKRSIEKNKIKVYGQEDTEMVV